MEKLDKSIPHFHKIALHELKKAILSLKKNNKNLKIIGFSGLAVTPEGIGLCENTLNCKEREFIIDEHILEKFNEKIIASTKKEADERIKLEYKYINRCKMLVLYPNEKSVRFF